MIFSLLSSKDLLDKAIYSMKQLSVTLNNPEYDYLLFDIIFTMNHLFEWFLKDKEIGEKIKIECIEVFNPFSSPYDVSRDFKNFYKKLPRFPKTNEYQLNVRLLCNEGKHSMGREITKKLNNTISVAGNSIMVAGNENAVADNYFNGYEIKINENFVNIEMILENLIYNWTGLFERKGL